MTPGLRLGDGGATGAVTEKFLLYLQSLAHMFPEQPDAASGAPGA